MEISERTAGSPGDAAAPRDDLCIARPTPGSTCSSAEPDRDDARDPWPASRPLIADPPTWGRVDRVLVSRDRTTGRGCDGLSWAADQWALMPRPPGDRRFLDLMNTMWWETSSYLSTRPSIWYRVGASHPSPTAPGRAPERQGRSLVPRQRLGLCRPRPGAGATMPADYPTAGYEPAFRDMLRPCRGAGRGRALALEPARPRPSSDPDRAAPASSPSGWPGA